jgi:antagonist of KipI
VKIEVVRAGFLTGVQDLGRTTFRELGVSLGGALDSFALRIANLVVGNDDAAPGLEITLGGLQLRFTDERIVAWGGGEFDVNVASTVVPAGHAAIVRAGEELKIGSAKLGCRGWLAISGGINVPVVLGSRSTDLRAGFGGLNGRALRDGDELSLGESRLSSTFVKMQVRSNTRRGELGPAADRQTAAAKRISSWSAPAHWTRTAKTEPILRFVRGSEWDRFNSASPAGTSTLQTEGFTVLTDSDRMGVRLEGLKLKAENTAELVSEAVAPGTIQVPPSGQPILLLGDCQTIGGYPKIAHVITVDLPTAAQLRPGDKVHFRETTLAEAHRLLADRENKLEQFRRGIQIQMQ